MYHIHPNKYLNKLFAIRPYQGVAPEEAKYLFVGLDANYDKEIEQSEVFPQVIEYLQDGVAFWEKYGVHHPFLLPAYRGDGKFFHRSFARIGLTKKYAKDVCFIELVDVPTYGKSSLEVDDLNINHLARIKRALEGGVARYVFISTSVGSLMKKSGMFPWLPSKPKATHSPLKLWGTVGAVHLLWHYHFSVYGKFEKVKSTQLDEIGRLLRGDTRDGVSLRLDDMGSTVDDNQGI